METLGNVTIVSAELTSLANYARFLHSLYALDVDLNFIIHLKFLQRMNTLLFPVIRCPKKTSLGQFNPPDRSIPEKPRISYIISRPLANTVCRQRRDGNCVMSPEASEDPVSLKSDDHLLRNRFNRSIACYMYFENTCGEGTALRGNSSSSFAWNLRI